MVTLTSLRITPIFFILICTLHATRPTTIGINYQQNSNSIPAVSAAALILKMGIPSVRLSEPEPAVIKAFSNLKISLIISLPNSFVPVFAGNRSSAELWLSSHVVPFYPNAKIKMISVGTDNQLNSSGNSNTLISAIRNLYGALRDIGFSNISVSTTFSFVNIMAWPFPPSNAKFNELVNRPLLQFLSETNSSFLTNIYPYDIVRLNYVSSIGFSMFENNPLFSRRDPATNITYANLYDMMVDAIITSLNVMGYPNIPLIVTETGWPSSDNTSEASAEYSQMYLGRLICHVKTGATTQLRKEGVAAVYIFELFDKSNKNGTQILNQWGLLYPNGTKKFRYIDFDETIKFNYKFEFSGMIIGLGIAALLVCWISICYCLEEAAENTNQSGEQTIGAASDQDQRGLLTRTIDRISGFRSSSSSYLTVQNQPINPTSSPSSYATGGDDNIDESIATGEEENEMEDTEALIRRNR